MDELKISQQAGVISTNLDTIEAEIKEKMADYKDYLVTEDSIKSDKKVLADLRKLLKQLNDARIATKKQWLEPFEEFEARCKAVASLVEEPINLINEQIKLFDDEKKVAKQAHIKELYEANIDGLEEYLPFDKILTANPKWLNASTKDQDFLFDLSGMVLKVKNDLQAIKSLNSEIEDDVISTYIKSGNDLAQAIARNTQYLSDKAKVVEQVKEVEPKVEPAPAPQPVKEETKPNTAKIVVSVDDLPQIKETLDFMGVKYEIEEI